MKDTLGKLFELQRLDDALRDTRTSRAALDTLRKQNAASLVIFDEMLTTRSANIEATQAFVKEKNGEIATTEDALKRSRSRMSAITSQRELTALNKELESNRRLNTQRREELSKLKAELAEAEADHARKQGERDDIKTQMSDLEAAKAAELAEKEQLAGEFTSRRETLRNTLPKPLVSRYDRILKARQGMAVSDCSDGRCEGCNMALYPQVFIKVQRMESMESCSHCSRIMICGSAFTVPSAT